MYCMHVLYPQKSEDGIGFPATTVQMIVNGTHKLTLLAFWLGTRIQIQILRLIHDRSSVFMALRIFLSQCHHQKIGSTCFCLLKRLGSGSSYFI